MPEGFETIPDWFSFENQGVGVAIADFGDGEQHLVVLMVDNPPQQNRAVYRVGHKLNAEGRVTGDWTPWIDVPDWFSWENQGAGITVADLSGDGSRDLVVLMIDNPPRQNCGLYRVGKNLNANGNVAEWTPWIEIPNWFSWENQGGGIAVTPPDAQGRRNLVVSMIDNPPEKNRGFYRMGKALDANGNVTGGWSDWLEVPDWFSWENQGGGMAVADLDGDGSQDLVVFMIDNVTQTGKGTSGQNQGYYKIGRKLGADGQTANWDKNWSSLPYWFTWENQGGSIDIAAVQGKKKLFSLIADNPPGKNEGFYQVVDLDSDPAIVGRWDRLPDLKNVGIHASVLPNRKVLFWGRRIDPDGILDPHECTPWVWDPKTRQEIDTPQPRLRNGEKVNLFCAGHAFMSDGRLLVAGGHLQDSNGSPQACTYNYQTNSWEPLPEMDTGRWYPTVTALADGRMLVSAGSYFKNNDPLQVEHNIIPQIWDGDRWRRVARFPEKALPLYPRLHIAPDGKVFMSGAIAQSYFIDLAKNAWERSATRGNTLREYAPSVMYDSGKVIYIGGGNDNDEPIPTAEAEIIDLGANPPAWQNTARVHFRRRQHNATLLPDGTILVTGGTSGDGFNNLNTGKPVHAAELWDPKTKKWTMLAAEDVDRCYHATAVLLPDATVLSAGSGEFNVNGPNVPPKANDAEESHRDAQIYHPPYLFRGPRPQITRAPAEVDYGKQFLLMVSGPEIGQVTWIRLPSVTHAFDENQRINFLEFSSGGGGLTVAAPPRPDLCPAGHYMLFVLSKAGVPSEARIVRIGPAAPQRHPALEAAFAVPEPQYYRDGKTPIEIEDEEIVNQATGTPVTVGLTSTCPYGLAACWAGAYEALTKLSGVGAVRPTANVDTSTAELFLRGQTLPDLDNWPQQFAASANGSYDFRGVEVRVTGTLREEAGELELIGPAFPAPARLLPLAQGMKVQSDYAARKPQQATSEELQAYDSLRQQRRSERDAEKPVCVTGPLTKSVAGWTLYIREFER